MQSAFFKESAGAEGGEKVEHRSSVRVKQIVKYSMVVLMGSMVIAKLSNVVVLHPWCSWLSRSLHTREAPGSNPGGCIFY